MSNSSSSSWISTEPSTRVLKERELEAQCRLNLEGNPRLTKLDEEGTFARLVPQNKYAREAFERLAETATREDPIYRHHKQFLHVDGRRDIDPLEREDCFVFSLGNLPEFPTIGWRIGSGRKNRSNLSVDICIHEGEGIAGLHARFCWVKGGGGFFLVADNLREVPVMLNGEVLKRTQRLIPYRNSITLGECNFSLQFQERSPEQEEQFQIELSAFYLKVMQEDAPMLLPTPSGNEVTIGNWIVRNPIASGSYGRVSVVYHMYTGQAAAAKELWRTQRNKASVDREVYIAKYLQNYKHERLGIPFEFYQKTIVDAAEKARYAKLLDSNWTPSSSDAISLHILYSPLSTSTFSTLIKSLASPLTRTQLFTQLLEGIAYLHSIGITHRDIKPGNITVRSYDPPSCQIIDFGCATRNKKTLYDRPGTVAYLAPEQKEGLWHAKEVDYWACALVGTELGGYVRRGNDRVEGASFERLYSWLDGEIEGEREKGALAQACKGMLKVEPGARMSAREVLEGILREYGDGNKGRKRGTEGEIGEASSRKGIRFV
ncbi:hypothetical protein HYFRA_00004107 [Hymenoscyphus fraxineus]|uniref:Protein kinase domain-containing protein n=1 Tax=Hymenoscyphus fraxineus TaxID=746836 RepID=A0A9N9KL89_9HELO|nr:hypothetical protein HYFRA_00004107 [Hymenoscyphus fraxineus]